MTTRAALLLVGAIAGMAIIIMALAAGQIAVSLFDAWSCLLWLGCVALFGLVRVWGFFSADRVRLLAADDGLHDLSKPASQPIPWADITTLRYTWTRATGYSFTAMAPRGEEFSWASQSRQWRDEAPDLADTGIHAPAVDGDAFTAIVAARTGLAPVQELW